jgi:predicted nucleotidyltransferase
MINPEIKNHLPQILEILKNNHVRRAYLFGSVLTDQFHEKSDIDIIVTIDESLGVNAYADCWWNIQFGLEDMLKREIDLISEDCIKNPYFQKEVDETREAIL